MQLFNCDLLYALDHFIISPQIVCGIVFQIFFHDEDFTWRKANNIHEAYVASANK
jgi:hypothetical protein